VLLRGVNRSGFEYNPAPIAPAELDHITRDWRANIVRLPFNQDWALHDPNYLPALDQAIETLAAGGAYTLLDLQWLDCERCFGPGRQFVPPLPDPNSPRVWSVLAHRYGANPAVLFDLFNEPHDRMDEDVHTLHCHDGSLYHPGHCDVTMTEWQPWAELLIDTIRRAAAETMIFCSGTNWAFDLRGFPLDRPNLVYSTHVYTNKGDDWYTAFGFLTRHAPVFAGEFGGRDGDVEWGGKLLDYFDELEMGWAAWSFSDDPHLVTRPDFAPTAFGELVRQRLRRPAVSRSYPPA
jgi:hypothetical protein